MGHDITAYIRRKTDTNPGSTEDVEAAYMRIAAFNTMRQRIFYGILKGAEEANGGVSGTGVTLPFTKEDIDEAIKACDYYMEDDEALMDMIGSKPHSKEGDTKAFLDIIQTMTGSTIDPDEAEPDYEQIREDLADTWKFLDDVLSAYNDAVEETGSAEILIEFY